MMITSFKQQHHNRDFGTSRDTVPKVLQLLQVLQILQVLQSITKYYKVLQSITKYYKEEHTYKFRIHKCMTLCD